MKITDSTKTLPGVATKLPKHKHANENPSIQISPEKIFNFIHTEKKNKVRPGLEPRSLGTNSTALPLGKVGKHLNFDKDKIQQ